MNCTETIQIAKPIVLHSQFVCMGGYKWCMRLSDSIWVSGFYWLKLKGKTELRKIEDNYGTWKVWVFAVCTRNNHAYFIHITMWACMHIFCTHHIPAVTTHGCNSFDTQFLYIDALVLVHWIKLWEAMKFTFYDMNDVKWCVEPENNTFSILMCSNLLCKSSCFRSDLLIFPLK